MHDVDRTLNEGETFEAGFGETATQEYEGEGEQFLGDILGGLLGGEFEQEGETLGENFEQGFLGEGEYEGEFEFEGEGEFEAVFDEVTEMELAAELLGLQNEQELEYFLGNLIKKATKVVGNIAKGPVGQALIPVLKKAAKVALPAAGAALGNLVLPGVGGMVGGKLASAAGSMFGLEFEGLSPQDREFEMAKRYVKFAGSAARKVARTPTRVPIKRAVQKATTAAAKKYVPGLLRPKVVTHVTNIIRQAQAAQAQAQAQGRPFGARVTPRPGVRPVPPRPATYGGYATYAQPTYAAGAISPTIVTPSYVTPATYGAEPSAIAGDGFTYATPNFTRSGRWYRRGRKIVLVGV